MIVAQQWFNFDCLICKHTYPCPSQHTNSGDLRVFVSLNLAVAYMKLGEERNTEVFQENHVNLRAIFPSDNWEGRNECNVVHCLRMGLGK